MTTRHTHLAAVQGAGEERKGIVQTHTVTAYHSLQRSNVAKTAGGVGSYAGQQASGVRAS